MRHRVDYNETWDGPSGKLVSSERVEIPLTDWTRAEAYCLFTPEQKSRIRANAPEMFELLSMASEPIPWSTIEQHIASLRIAGLLSNEEFTALTVGELEPLSN